MEDLVAGLAEDGLKRPDVLRVRADNVEYWLMILESHFNGIQERMQGLVLQAGRTAVPEHCLEVHGVDHSGRVARSRELVDTLRDAQRTIGKGLVFRMARSATDLARSTEPGIVEQLVSESDLLGRLRIILRVGHGRQA